MPVRLHISPKNYASDLHLSHPTFKFSNFIKTLHEKQILTLIKTSVLNDQLHYLISFIYFPYYFITFGFPPFFVFCRNTCLTLS
jgi:hypothetical protein